MNPQAAQRAAIAPFHVMEVMRAAAAAEAEGRRILHLEVGQPSTSAPARVLEAARAGLDADLIGYTNALGNEALRTRIAVHYDEWYGVAVDPAEVAVTVGASGGCVLAFLAAFDAGDRVAVTAPGYPCYRNILEALGVEVVTIELGADTGYRLTPDLLDTHGPLKGVVVASPSNPTGTMLDEDGLRALARWCDGTDAWLVSDEIYHGLSFAEPAVSARSVSERAIVVNSFSKYFSMTGWRLGWLLVPDPLRGAVERLAQNLFISAPTLSQIAATAAFDCHDELGANVERYRRNRAVLLEGLPAAGIDRLAPADGAFYVYADVSHLGDDAQALCRRWLDELDLAVTPGIDFDPRRGRGSVRFSFAGTTADAHDAMDRLGTWTRRVAGAAHP